MKSDIIKIMKKLIFSTILISSLLYSCSAPQSSYDTQEKQDGKFYYEMGISSLNTGNNAQAIAYLLEAIKSYKTPESYNALALAYQFSGEYKKAEEIFKEGLSRYPDNPELLTNLGVLYAMTSREKEAISYLEKAISNPTYSKKDRAYYNLGLIYRNLGNETLFLENINKSLMYNSNFVDAYIVLGDHYYEKYSQTGSREFLKTALLYYLKAINLGYNSGEIYYKIGKIYIILGEKELAKYYLEKALKVVSDKDPMKNEIKNLLINIAEGKTEGLRERRDNSENVLKDLLRK
ncbi:MAG: tetratricopeptide repeat protein [Hydrogenothermaceae bacterium]|nr:tetratricopeptide repeat protein [Hydrogenothermaceae bacterium]